jgi:hypothetical protein
LEGFNSDAVVDRATYSLPAAEILFCSLNGDMREEKLDVPGGAIGHLPQSFGLLGGKPVAEAHTQVFGALYSTNPGG